jgi:hypothetical protein
MTMEKNGVYLDAVFSLFPKIGFPILIFNIHKAITCLMIAAGAVK